MPSSAPRTQDARGPIFDCHVLDWNSSHPARMVGLVDAWSSALRGLQANPLPQAR